MSSVSQFDRVAEIYDRIRPRYPDRLFSDLFRYLGGDPEDPGSLATVEIGPGTGQATGALLKRGATVAAVEPGPHLAVFLRGRFPDEPRLVVINERFEDAPLPDGIADLVFAATSFHWLDRDTRYAKTLELLRPGGVLAIARATINLAEELCDGRLAVIHEGGYSQSYAPVCGLAIIEELLGIDSGIADNLGGQPRADRLRPAYEVGLDVERALTEVAAAQSPYWNLDPA